MTRFVLDAGAFVALERRDRFVWSRFADALSFDTPRVTHGGIVGQVWRQPGRQARLASALRSVDVLPLSAGLGRQAGALLAITRTTDVLDAALACLCRPGDVLYTSDVDDLLDLLDAARTKNVAVVRV